MVVIKILILTEDRDTWVQKITSELRSCTCRKMLNPYQIQSGLFFFEIRSHYSENCKGECWSCVILDQYIPHELEVCVLRPCVKSSIIRTKKTIKLVGRQTKMLIINLFGAPGAGKSTGAAYVFSQLKAAGVNAELVTEFAKDKVWEGTKAVFENQAYIFGKQYFRISRLEGKVDVVITDSPILLSAFYNDNDHVLGEEFDKLVFKVFDYYNRIDVFVHRVKPYNEAGRFQTEEESDAVSKEMLRFLDKFGVDCLHINGDFAGYDSLVDTVLDALAADGKPFVCPHPSDVCPRPSDSAEALTIKVRYLSDKIQPLEYIDGKSDWVDLRAAEDVELKTGESKLIPLGIAMQLPKGYEAIVAPRSSTYKNFGIRQTNSIGVIDETYCGDNDQWYFPARADRHTVIHAGDRICQFRIEKHQPQLFFESVDTLGNADRGGIGSTGKR